MMSRLRFLMITAALIVDGCVPVRPPHGPIDPPKPVHRTIQITVRGNGDILPEAQGTLWDDFGSTVACHPAGVLPNVRMLCEPLPAMKQGNGFHIGVQADEWQYQQVDFVSCVETVAACWPNQDLGEVALSPVKPKSPPVGSKVDFWVGYQGNFGTIKMPGCGLHMDALFDPYLLWAWQFNRTCFESMMSAHAYRNDNRVAVDPRAGYHGFNDVDLWHDPSLFVEFVQDVRGHVNASGEHFKVQVFMAADEHVNNLRDETQFAHWKSDVDGLAAVGQDAIDAVVTCWECRHQNDWISAKRYVDMGRYLAHKFPRAVHLQHLISGSSSWSSWRCDPQQAGSCQNPSDGPGPEDADDPNRGNEINAWHNCLREGWCDGFLYQFEIGSSYLYPSPGHDAMDRYVEIVERLGDDERSLATSRGDRHTWPQVPVVAFENIYDHYWQRDPKATEAYAVEWCKRAMALGGRGCGSASWRP